MTAFYRPTTGESRELDDIERLLRTWEDDGGVRRAVHRLRSLLRADISVSYSLTLDEHWLVDRVESAGPLAVAALRRGFAASGPNDRVVLYDPRRPALRDRNTVRRLLGIRGVTEQKLSSLPVVRWLGIERQDQVRVLLCDGSSLLSWLGGVRQDPFTEREAALLERVSTWFRARFMLERQLGDCALNAAALACALSALDVAAYVVAKNGYVVHANESGAVELSRRGRALRAELRTAIESPHHSGYRVLAVEMRGCADYHLVLFTGAHDDLVHRTRALAQRFRLTGRQSRVLALVARGDTNKQIAVKLKIAPKTAEVHVSAVLKKMRCDSRARLIACFWSPAEPT